MSTNPEITALTNREYEAGFTTDVESETVAPGLDENVIRRISEKKSEPAAESKN